MGTVELFLIIAAAFLLSGIGFYFFSIIFAANRIYILTLKRKDTDSWSRENPALEGRQVEMDAIGIKWRDEHLQYKKDVQTERNGLKLYGEYYDFGHDRAVMILSGRTESLRYGYYFARPYEELGFNVLVFDSRAHGKSDGEYNTVGFEESLDDIEWVRYLQREHGVKSVLFHGICIGAAGGILAITNKDCPDCVMGIVTEGMFTRFAESMRNHIIERKKNFWPVVQFVDFWMKHYTGHSMMRGPVDRIGDMKLPILMLQSREDKYSTPENARKLYDICGSEHKELVYFDVGGHSLLRVNNTEKYDEAIKNFAEKHFI